MTLYQNKYRVEPARLAGWDYSISGYYFITICTHNRVLLFGEIANGEMQLNNSGNIVLEEWVKSFTIRPELIRDEFTLMPNHFHGIVQIKKIIFNDNNNGHDDNAVETHGRASNQIETHGRASLRGTTHVMHNVVNKKNGIAYRPPKSLPSFIAGVKSVITKRINVLRNTPGARVLQYRFHDHIIRDQNELFRIRQYIRNNPTNWNNDVFVNTTTNSVREDKYNYEMWMSS